MNVHLGITFHKQTLALNVYNITWTASNINQRTKCPASASILPLAYAEAEAGLDKRLTFQSQCTEE